MHRANTRLSVHISSFPSTPVNELGPVPGAAHPEVQLQVNEVQAPLVPHE